MVGLQHQQIGIGYLLEDFICYVTHIGDDADLPSVMIYGKSHRVGSIVRYAERSDPEITDSKILTGEERSALFHSYRTLRVFPCPFISIGQDIGELLRYYRYALYMIDMFVGYQQTLYTFVGRAGFLQTAEYPLAGDAGVYK